MSTDSYSAQLHESAYGPLKAHADAWIQTVAPPETFLWADVPECARNKFRSLVEAGQPVEQVERVERADIEEDYNPDGSSSVWLYRWHPRAWETIEHQVETQYSPCPCGHSGFQNHGEYYTCSYGGCDDRYGREDLEVGR